MHYWEIGIIIGAFALATVLGVMLCCLKRKTDVAASRAKQVVHDLRNLLAGMNGAAEILALKLADNPQLKSYAEIILRAGEQGRRMLSAENKMPDFQVISLNECVGETLDLLKHSVSGNIVVESFCGAEQDRINGNADLVRRLLMNLGINAAEAMPQGGTIRIKTANCDFSGGELPEAVAAVQPGKYVCLEVSDTGKGIEPAVRSRIFEAAFSTKPFGGGTGLSVVREVVQSHAAGLTVDSDVGKGSCFRVYFPLARKQVNGRVLIVDDEPLLRGLLGEMLKISGMDVLEAGSGREAIELYARYPEIDAVVLDVVMPGMSGVETYEALRRQNPNVKVMFASGGEREDIPAGKNIAFVQKPYQMAEVSGELQRLLATEQDS